MTTGSITINEIKIHEVDTNPDLAPGLLAPIGSLAVLDGEAKLWQKFGSNDIDWKLVSLSTKSGMVIKTNFAGNPKKASVVFGTPYPDANYTPQILSGEPRVWTYESQTANGFVINANANQVLTADVRWSTIYNGESS